MSVALVLIVEDRPDDRKLLVTLLNYAGHSVVEAVNGMEGLTRTRERRPDLVIADMLVPGMDGLDFARAVRRDPEIAETPIILYTATYEPWELEKLARAAGISRVLVKAAEPEEILRNIADVLGEPQAARTES
jgi:two-component system cell cycle sensor histidine kinase/response regulator CckA